MGLYQIKSEEKFMRAPFFISVLLALSLCRNAAHNFMMTLPRICRTTARAGRAWTCAPRILTTMAGDLDLVLSKGYAVFKYQICI
ncbi:hypothetical protein DCC62_32665 [candidate division KSB1 bacterium]|nr:MAG: hypothetical protein DCC62_32665 [candidate division KSB1 bacterium]